MKKKIVIILVVFVILGVLIGLLVRCDSGPADPAGSQTSFENEYLHGTHGMQQEKMGATYTSNHQRPNFTQFYNSKTHFL